MLKNACSKWLKISIEYSINRDEQRGTAMFSVPNDLKLVFNTGDGKI